MDHHSKLVALFLALLCGGVHAGYAQLQSPVGFSGSPGAGWSYWTTAANGDTWTGKTVLTNASLNVGGQAVKVPATMRLAANAGRFVASAAFGNPLILLAAAGAGLLYDYYAGQDVYSSPSAGGGSQWTKHIPGTTTPCTVDCTRWIGYNGAVFFTVQAAANSLMGRQNCPAPGGYANYPHTVVQYVADGRWWGSFARCESSSPGTEIPFSADEVLNGGAMATSGQVGQTTVSGVTTPGSYEPLTEGEFHAKMDPVPLPDWFPGYWPKEVPVAWPMEQPVINPSPQSVPQPLRVPVGDPSPVPLPVPNPENLPQTWRQPVVDIVPSPTPLEPWRVDVQPRDVISLSPSPITAPVPVPSPTPEAPGSPTEEKPPGLCDQYPDILACAKPSLGDLSPTELPNEDRAMAIAKDDGWGPSNGSCPAARTATVMGKTLSMPMTGICDFASAIRPIMIGLAWFSAALVFFGLGRKE